MGFREGFLFIVLGLSLINADARGSAISDITVTELVLERPQAENEVSEILKVNDQVCSVCENFTAEAINYLNENKTQDEIIGKLHLACSELKSFEQQCVLLVDYYAMLFFAEFAKINPEDFCKDVNLCGERTYATLPKSNSTCVFCRHIIDEILIKLKDPDAQFEILEVLLQECNKMENYTKECKRMVLNYAPLILVNGEKFLETTDVCAVIHVCEGGHESYIQPALAGASQDDA